MSSLPKSHRSMANCCLFLLKRFGAKKKRHKNLNRKKINPQGLFSLLMANIKIKAAQVTSPHPSRLSNCQQEKFLIRNAHRRTTHTGVRLKMLKHNLQKSKEPGHLELTKAKIPRLQIKVQTIQLIPALGENLY